MPREKAGALKRPTDEQCIAVTGCSRAELARDARVLPIGTVMAAFGLTADVEVSAGFINEAVAALKGNEVADGGE